MSAPTTGLNAKSPPCLVCTNKITSRQMCVMCNICQRWTHPDCSNIVPELLKYLVKESKQGLAISWSCEACRVASEILSSQIAAMNRNIEDMKKDITELKTSQDKHEDKLEEVNKKCDENAKKQHETREEVEKTVFAEMRERDEKKNNFLVHGVPEVVDDSLKGFEKKEIDLTWLHDIADTIGVGLDNDKDIKFVRRLGEKKDNVDVIRPMLVGCYEVETKNNMLKKCKELSKHEEWAGVYLVTDLTLQQRKEEDQLYTDMHRKNSELTEEQKSLNLEWMVVGPKGGKRLTLGKKRMEAEGWRRKGGTKRGRGEESSMRRRVHP